MTSKIHMLADALGRPLRLILTGGQVHDIVTAPALLEGTVGRLSHKIDREWGACGVRRTGLNSPACFPLQHGSSAGFRPMRVTIPRAES